MVPGRSRRWPRARAASRSTPPSRRSPGPRSPPAPRSSTTCRPRCATVAADLRRRAGSPCTCRASPAPCRPTRTTTTWSPRSRRSSPSGPSRPRPPASPRSGSTRASASARRPSTTWRCSRHLDRLVAARATRCSSAPAARASSARLLAASDGRRPSRYRDRRPARGLRWPPRRGPWPQGAAMVRVHDVAATVAAHAAAGPQCQSTNVGRHEHREAPRGSEGQVGAGHRAPQLPLGHQGPARGLRAPGRLRRQPPPGPSPGGDHLGPRAGLRAGDLARSRRRTTCTTTTSWASPGGTGPSRPRRRRRSYLAALLPELKSLLAAGRQGAHPRRGARRPHLRAHRRLPAVGRAGRHGPRRPSRSSSRSPSASSARSAASSSPWPRPSSRRDA